MIKLLKIALFSLLLSSAVYGVTILQYVAPAGGGAPVVEAGWDKQTGVGATLTMNKPSGCTTGDTYILFGGSATQVLYTTPTGFTEIANGNSLGHAFGLYYRIVDGTETSTIAFGGPTSNDKTAYYICVSGTDGTTPLDVAHALENSGGNATVHNISEVTTTVDDTIAMYFLTLDRNGLHSVSGTGWSESDEAAQGQGSSSWGTKEMPSSGGTGTATVTTVQSNGTQYLQLAWKP